jgi:osmotically-inducible protein OsmY
MKDLDLRQDILDELEFDPRVDAANVGVTVDDGIVTLTGHVGSYAERMAAERGVQRVKGVRAIAQEIEVRTTLGALTAADDEIARRILDMMAWNTQIPQDAIKIKVQKGWVTLTGEVEWDFQRVAAENAVWQLFGVLGVFNVVTVQPRVTVADVRHRIENALKRNAEVEAAGIRISVDGGKVVLEGKVRAWHERKAVEQAAWATPGVSAVEDRLVIQA